MKNSKLLSLLLISSFSIAVYAAPLFQAGNIEEGKKVSISSTTGVASYFAEGTSGKVQFSCNLQGAPGSDGEETKALLRTGKNFDNQFNNPVTPLSQGENGPFIWTLTDEKATVGNIKVFYVAGNNVTLQCYGKKI